MRLLLMGPPGAGKGTQADAICHVYGVPAISTGDIFRANVAAQTPLGRMAQAHMQAGDYVPDDVTNAMVRDRLAEADCDRGFLLDGYPRTVEQVAELAAILAELDVQLDGVLVLDADTDALADRLLARARSEGRVDDTIDIIRRRQQIYVDQTAPLVSEYAARKILMSIDGNGHVEHITDRVHTAISKLRHVARHA